jgi:hypothetical protein
MTPLTRSFALSIICIVLSLPLYPQENDAAAVPEKKKSRFSIAFGAAAGNFALDAQNFNTVYSNRSISRIYFAGIGTNTVGFIAKYRQFYAFGRSVVENIEVEGKADWRQKFYAGGLRMRGDDQPIYADILYVVTQAEETITTSGEPAVERLTTRYTTENKGVGFAVGVSIKLIGPIGIFVEGEYSVMTRKGRNPEGRVNPELGGFCASAGAQFVL